MISVRFTYLTGLKRRIFRNARLDGSWNDWAELPMTEITAEDGCPAFTAMVDFHDSEAGTQRHWGVRFDGPGGPNTWAVNLEVHDARVAGPLSPLHPPGAGTARARSGITSRLAAAWALRNRTPAGAADARAEIRRMGAERREGRGGLRRVRQRLHRRRRDGHRPLAPGHRPAAGRVGIWESAPVGDFSRYVGLPYMFRIENAQGEPSTAPTSIRAGRSAAGTEPREDELGRRPGYARRDA